VAGYATIAPRQRGRSRARSTSYLDPIYQGLGLANTCSRAAAIRSTCKPSGSIVWALLDNTAACDFYWRFGGRPVASSFTKIGGARLEKVAHLAASRRSGIS
jgi:hypothetical protein